MFISFPSADRVGHLEVPLRLVGNPVPAAQTGGGRGVPAAAGRPLLPRVCRLHLPVVSRRLQIHILLISVRSCSINSVAIKDKTITVLQCALCSLEVYFSRSIVMTQREQQGAVLSDDFMRVRSCSLVFCFFFSHTTSFCPQLKEETK